MHKELQTVGGLLTTFLFLTSAAATFFDKVLPQQKFLPEKANVLH